MHTDSYTAGADARVDDITDTKLCNQWRGAKANRDIRDHAELRSITSVLDLKTWSNQLMGPQALWGLLFNGWVIAISPGNLKRGNRPVLTHRMRPHCQTKRLRGKVCPPLRPIFFTPGQNTNNTYPDLFLPGSKDYICLRLASQETPSYIRSVM